MFLHIHVLERTRNNREWVMFLEMHYTILLVNIHGFTFVHVCKFLLLLAQAV